MSSLTIQDLDEATEHRIRMRAALHKRSVEEEVKEILRATVNMEPPSLNLAQRLQERFQEVHGVELELPSREALRTPPEFLEA